VALRHRACSCRSATSCQPCAGSNKATSTRCRDAAPTSQQQSTKARPSSSGKKAGRWQGVCLELGHCSSAARRAPHVSVRLSHLSSKLLHWTNRCRCKSLHLRGCRPSCAASQGCSREAVLNATINDTAGGTRFYARVAVAAQTANSFVRFAAAASCAWPLARMCSSIQTTANALAAPSADPPPPKPLPRAWRQRSRETRAGCATFQKQRAPPSQTNTQHANRPHSDDQSTWLPCTSREPVRLGAGGRQVAAPGRLPLSPLGESYSPRRRLLSV
jgi:hypothetical protein